LRGARLGRAIGTERTQRQGAIAFVGLEHAAGQYDSAASRFLQRIQYRRQAARVRGDGGLDLKIRAFIVRYFRRVMAKDVEGLRQQVEEARSAERRTPNGTAFSEDLFQPLGS
jgi:hypothetical protein